MQHHLEFMKTKEPAIRSSLQLKTTPAFETPLYARIWMPENWIITPYGKDPVQYRVEKYTCYSLKSNVYGWRIRNIFYRTYTCFNNGLFWIVAGIIFLPLFFIYV
jgi:hypothetical protein